MKHSLFASVLLSGVCALPCMAAAQTAAPSAAAPASGANQLQEVIVTAQRRTESAQRAGIAISVVQPEALATVTSPQQLTKAVPALQIGSAGGTTPLLYIRGVGTFSANPYTDPGVAVNYDGVYIGRPIAMTGFFYDLERLEVLKGPQGTLYGRNATGGALNILPNKPQLGSFFGDVSAQYGNYDALNVQGAVNIPLGDQMAVRISGIDYEHSGYNTDGTYSENGKGVRFQLRADPTEKLSFRVAYDYFHLGGTGAAASLLATSSPTGAYVPTNLSPEVGMFDPRTLAVLNSPAAFVATAGAPYGTPAFYPHVSNDYMGLTGEANADLGFGNLTTIVAWRTTKTNEASQPFDNSIFDRDRDGQFSAEARLSGALGPVDWLGGLFYYDENIESVFSVQANVLAAVQPLSQETKSKAAFGRLTFHATDTLRFTGAARYTSDHKSIDGVANSAIAICTAPTGLCPDIRRYPGIPTNITRDLGSIGYIQPPGVPVFIDALGTSNVIWAPSTVPVNDSLDSNKLTYRLAAEYDVAPRSMLYASYETGYRSGGFSFSTVKPTYDPETIKAYTLGAKNRFFDNRLQVNVEAFLWKYSNQQLSHQAIGRTGNIEFVTENIGSSTNKGFEVDVVAKPAHDTLLSADIQYLDASNDVFVYSEPDQSITAGLPPGTLRPASQCPSTVAPGGLYRIDCSNLRAMFSPMWTLNLGAQQTFHPTDALKVVLEVDSHYQSSSILMFERREGAVQSAYWLFDASATLAKEDDKWQLVAFIENIADKRAAGQTYYDSLSRTTSANYNHPRTYGVRVKARF